MLNAIASLIGRLLARKVIRDVQSFHQATMRPRETQHEFLMNLISRHAQSSFGRDHHFSEIRTVADYRRQMQIAEYDYFEPYIERVKEGETSAMFCDEKVVMFSLTSGSSNARKFIPVTGQYLSDYRRGWSMWGLQTFWKYPQLFLQPKIGFGSAAREFTTSAGIPCGSLSGLTANMNPAVVRRTYCLPSDTADWADAQYRCYLNWRVGLHRNLGMAVAPNPGLLLQFARFGDENADQLIREVHDGGYSGDIEFPRHLKSWLKRQLRPNPKRAAELEAIRSHAGRLYPVDVWPNLKLVACWLGGPTRAYLSRIPEYYGNAALRDIGLISSESRISLPKEDHTPGGILDISSAYFEFIPVAEVDSTSPTILEAAELETGAEYYILLTTTSGLYRYNIHDVVKVIDWHERTPIIEFLHKGARIANLFGEKLTESQVVHAVQNAAEASRLAVGDYAIAPPTADEPIAYRAMVEFRESVSGEDRQRFARQLDESLGAQNYLYERKRREGLMEPLQLVVLNRGTWRSWDMRQLGLSGGTLDQYKHPFLITDRSKIADIGVADTVGSTSAADQWEVGRTSPARRKEAVLHVATGPTGGTISPAEQSRVDDESSTGPSNCDLDSDDSDATTPTRDDSSQQNHSENNGDDGPDDDQPPTGSVSASEARPEKAPPEGKVGGHSRLRYAAWLMVSLVCHLGITWTLSQVAGFSAQISFLISLTIVTAVNFCGLRRFVFRATRKSVRRQLVPFVVLNLLLRANEYVTFALIHRYAAPSVLFSIPVVLGLSTAVRYMVYRHWVFLD